MPSLLRPDDLRAPRGAVEAEAFLRSRAPRSASALAACAAMVNAMPASANRRDSEVWSAAPSLQDKARTPE